ncbi:MAG: bifunctional phosphoribosylaminoimidazolecarboxamide formyltransferase/IMP cyclohydrolase PurH [Chloroflexi bacterium]|nr:MAG: bifunctional phosphoribosylaminoimidazolecarboxamide formyltransferase/IMP cyclohydrolase PurH [Chloroflexota bacterium]
MKKQALLSVYDKTGLIPFAQSLIKLGWTLIASGGTARTLQEAQLPVTPVSDLTQTPEILGGRVKTLHPAIHGGILARDTPADMAELTQHGITPITLVVCNLYPFQDTVSRAGISLNEAVEQIDIGGVTLLRAAAKNFARVTVICDPADYDRVLSELQANGKTSETTRLRLAVKAFQHTRDYDNAITAYFQRLLAEEPTETAVLPPRLTLHLIQTQPLRYGENPHQAAALYTTSADTGPLGGTLLQGKPLSYNNLLDLDAAWRTATAFDNPTVVIVKHLSPCGIASAQILADAFPAALASDPVSAFGGVIACNRTVGMPFVQALDHARLFVEAIVAPGFASEVRHWFAQHKRNCRLLALGDTEYTHLELRAIRGGVLAQQPDTGDPASANWRVVTDREPTEKEWEALRFAWLAVQHVKSNAIVFATRQATVGIGGGLPSRVDAVKLAAAKARDRAQGAVMASDAFFPFPDGVEEAARAGITAVIQPGGSIRDQDVINSANRLGLAMVFTGVRHFRH